MSSRRKVIYVVVLMLVLSTAGLAAGLTSSKLHFPKHLDPTGIWLPVLVGSLSGVVFIQVRNRSIYRTIGAARNDSQQLKNSVDASRTGDLTKGSFNAQSNRAW